jgi:DDE superfamily endonuclease
LQAAFPDCFARSEPRAYVFDSMGGQVRQRARKSIEPMALHVAGGTIRGLQRFLSAGVWEEEQMLWNSHQLVAEELGDPDGVLLFDATGCLKKGKDSVGVARPYCGPLAKESMVRSGCVPARPHGLEIPSWTSGCSGLTCGGRTRLRPAVPGATCPMREHCRAHRSWQQPCERLWRRRGSCRSRRWWLTASRARAPPGWTPWRRVADSRHGWRSRPRRVAGSRVPGPRIRAPRRRETSEGSAWWSPRTTHRAWWRRWRRHGPRPAGSAGRCQKGRRGRSRMRVPGNA